MTNTNAQLQHQDDSAPPMALPRRAGGPCVACGASMAPGDLAHLDGTCFPACYEVALTGEEYMTRLGSAR